MKALHYAYPSSPFAIKHHAPFGCYYIEIDGKAVQVYPNENKKDDRKLEALEAFEAMPQEIDIGNSFTRDSLIFMLKMPLPLTSTNSK
jgi:hypothetical protein